MGVRRRSSRGGITGQWCYEGGYGGMGVLKWVEEERVMKKEGEEGEESNAKSSWEIPRPLNGVMTPAAMMLPLRDIG